MKESITTSDRPLKVLLEELFKGLLEALEERNSRKWDHYNTGIR